jgi:hypothetical protein
MYTQIEWLIEENDFPRNNKIVFNRSIYNCTATKQQSLIPHSSVNTYFINILLSDMSCECGACLIGKQAMSKKVTISKLV